MTAALLVIDMQVGFCEPSGSVPLGVGPLHDVGRAIAGCIDAIEAARRAELSVIFTRHQYLRGYRDTGRNFKRLGGPIAEVGGLVSGSADAEILSDMGVTDDDIIVDKSRYDAFHATNLDGILRCTGIDHLFVCGVATQVCVETTVRSAFIRDYRVTLLPDACAGWTQELHENSVNVLKACRFVELLPRGSGYDLSSELERQLA